MNHIKTAIIKSYKRGTSTGET